jgi:hypothetical protein
VNTATSAAAMSYGDDLRDLRDETSYGDDLHDEPASAEPGEPGGPAGFHPSGDADASFDAPRGRAARRRQLARWKKNKRRAAVATAVALVGGGLTLASMDRQSTDRAQAASAPDNRSMGAAGEETTGESTPDATPPGTHHSSHPTGPAHTQRQTAGSTAYRQSAHSVAAAPRTTVPNTHPDEHRRHRHGGAAAGVRPSARAERRDGHHGHLRHATDQPLPGGNLAVPAVPGRALPGLTAWQFSCSRSRRRDRAGPGPASPR